MSKTLLEDRVEAIEHRNSIVETNKAWETSWTRRISISLLTYIIAVLFLDYANLSDDAWLAVLVPAVGYLVSTLTLGILRSHWEKRL